MQTPVSAGSSDKAICPSCCGRGVGAFTQGNVCPATRQKRGGQGVPPTTSPAQNNPYAEVSCFGVAYSDPFQMHVLRYYFYGINPPKCRVKVYVHFIFYRCGRITFLKGGNNNSHFSQCY